MALLWVEGFEKFGTGTLSVAFGVRSVGLKYHITSTSVMSMETGRYGGLALRLNNSMSRLNTPSLGTSNSTLISGVAFKITAVTGTVRILDFRDPGNYGASTNERGLAAEVLASREIRIMRGDTLLDTSTTANIQDDTWYYLEMKVLCANSGGRAWVHLDGVEIIDFTGDTELTRDLYTSVSLKTYTSSVTYFDDWYICDATGSTNNDFLGECRVETLTPNSDASGNWTANSGGDLYAMVDGEIDEVDYVHETVSGNQALFGSNCLSANASAGSVRGVMVSCESNPSGQFTKYAKMMTQNGSGGAIQESGNFVPGSRAPTASTEIMEADPDGASWTPNTINTFRMGVEVS